MERRPAQDVSLQGLLEQLLAVSLEALSIVRSEMEQDGELADVLVRRQTLLSTLESCLADCDRVQMQTEDSPLLQQLARLDRDLVQAAEWRIEHYRRCLQQTGLERKIRTYAAEPQKPQNGELLNRRD